ncbi:MAG: hypothetical protein ABI691_20770 [Ginsengibacter sp.]
MIVYLKYLILRIGFTGAIMTLAHKNIGAGITSTGAFIAFALIEAEDLKITNKDD